jgi:hypothetical protein
MRLKIVSLVLLLGISFGLCAQDVKSRSDFFKEFYGTYLKPLDIQVDISADTLGETTPDLKPLILQYENLYDFDIPASDEAAFKSREDVTAWVTRYLDAQPAEIPQVSKAKKAAAPKDKHSWRLKLYGSYGAVETGGVTGGVTGGGHFDGNLFGTAAFKRFNEMYTWEAGFAFHPYGWNGKAGRSHRSWGLSYDFAQFSHIGADTVYVGYESDTTATRWGISLNFQQDLTGRNRARPKVGFYLMESLRFGVHSYQFIDPVLRDINHLSYGIGLAQGIYFYIFDLKFYQNVAYSPDIIRLLPAGYPLLRSLDLEFGLRLGIALKF